MRVYLVADDEEIYREWATSHREAMRLFRRADEDVTITACDAVTVLRDQDNRIAELANDCHSLEALLRLVARGLIERQKHESIYEEIEQSFDRRGLTI